MAFIHATDASSEDNISINIDHIVSFYPNEQQTIIQTTAVRDEKAIRYFVQESYNDVANKIHDALLEGRR